MKRKLLSLTLILSLLLGMMLPTLAEGEDVPALIIPDGSFEEEGKGWTLKNGAMINLGLPETPAHTGQGYLYIGKGPDAVVSFSLMPETDYVLRFWARTTVKEGSTFDLRFLAEEGDYHNVEGYVNGEHYYKDTFGIGKTEPAEDETDTRLDWDEYSFEFTTPSKALGGRISFYSETDDLFCLDDVSLTPSGREPNLVRNGYFLGMENNGKKPTAWAIDPPETGATEDVKVTYDRQPDGDVYATFTKFDGPSAKYYYYTMGVPMAPGRYKLSFDYENYNPTERDRVPTIEINGDRILSHEGPNMLLDCTENKYEYYFTVDTSGLYKLTVKPHGIPEYKFPDGKDLFLRISNIRIWKDEASVQYGKTATYTMDAHGNARRDIILPITKISEADKNDAGTAYVVLPKGHYFPDNNETEEFMMVNALYRKYEDGRRIFESVTFANGEASGGMVSNVNDSIEVPVLTGEEDYTYEIQSYLWKGVNGMEPVADKTVLTY